MKIQKLAFAPVLAAGMLFGMPAHAVPSLQLDIAGGTYVGGDDQTVYSSSGSFSRQRSLQWAWMYQWIVSGSYG